MVEDTEKRGPIEKGKKGWPINPFGVTVLALFGLIIIFLIAKPLFNGKVATIQNEQGNATGGTISAPTAGEIVKSDKLTIILSVDNPPNIQKVQFWAKAYAGGTWQVIGEKDSEPYTLDWQIPPGFQNKAIAITSHIFQKDGNIIKDPGGWREGIIILSQ